MKDASNDKTLRKYRERAVGFNNPKNLLQKKKTKFSNNWFHFKIHLRLISSHFTLSAKKAKTLR